MPTVKLQLKHIFRERSTKTERWLTKNKATAIISVLDFGPKIIKRCRVYAADKDKVIAMRNWLGSC